MKQFVTQNLFIVIMVGITVLALAVSIYPMMKVGDAREHAGAIAAKDIEVKNALHNYESPLWTGLSEEGIHKVQSSQEKVIEVALKKAYRTPLLVNGELIFPVPDLVDNSRVDFQRHYRRSLALRDPANPDDRWLDTLEAGWLPTTEDIAKEKDRVREEKKNNMGPADLDALVARVPTDLLARRTQDSRTWASKSCFDDYIARVPGADSTTVGDEMLWEMLLNWWVQRDVVNAIAAVNKTPVNGVAPRNVLQSPIKELVFIEVDRNYLKTGGTGAGSTVTLTGRVSYDRYDVLLYRFQVVMDPSKFPLLADALGKQNFHTVLLAQCDTLDKKGAGRSAGGVTPVAAALLPAAPPGPAGGPAPLAGPVEFDYGGDSVMVVTLQCETVFMKSPASWQTNPDQALGKRLAFLSRSDDNKKLVMAVHKIVAGRRSVLLPYSRLHDKTAAGAAAAELDACLQTALVKFVAGKDPKTASNNVKRLIEDDKALPPAKQRFALLHERGADSAWVQATLNEDLQFIALYEDLMPEAAKKAAAGAKK